MEIDIKDHIPVNVLENYIEKYPEDAEKWLEFINIKEPLRDTALNRVRAGIIEEQLLNSNMEIFTEDTTVQGAVQGAVQGVHGWQRNNEARGEARAPLGAVDATLLYWRAARAGQTLLGAVQGAEQGAEQGAVQGAEQGAVQPEGITNETGCLICNKLWATTETIPRSTMLCGHTFHTVCILDYIFENEFRTCVVENCSINTFEYVREIQRRKRGNKETIEGILIKSLINENSKKSGFNGDLKLLKKHISNYKTLRQRLHTNVRNIRNEIIHKHLYSINNIKQDMNNSLKELRTSEVFLEFRRSLRQYRKHAASVYRKYHLSLKDLIDNNLIKLTWGTRWELQRHGQFRLHRLGIRLYPGSKPFKDPINATDT